jgi:hypothetical protein
VIAAIAFFQVDRGDERAAIGELPAQERRALYERTLRTLASSCAPIKQRQGLADHCREQAEFIVQFPECDGACRALAEPHQRKPTR